MNRRLALTVAGSSALVVITAGAAVAANLGILSSSPSSGVGQLDATRVAELAVATPASIEAIQPNSPEVAPEDEPVQPSTGTGVASAPRTVAPSSVPVVSTSPPVAADGPQTPSIRTDDSRDEHEDEDEDEDEYETEDHEGSLDDRVQDDSFEDENPHTVETVVVSESDS